MNQFRFPEQPRPNKVLEVGGKRERVPVDDGSRDSMPARERKRLLDLFNQFDWDRDYDYKRGRSRG